jgi:hypothetical protein
MSKVIHAYKIVQPDTEARRKWFNEFICKPENLHINSGMANGF